MQADVISLSLLLSGILYLGLALVAWRMRANTGAKTFTALMLAAGIYSLAYYFEIHSQGISAVLGWIKIEYLGIATIPALWLIFTLQYTGQEHRLNKSIIAALFVIPLITLIMVYTNDYHHLHYHSVTVEVRDGLSVLSIVKGPWYWVHISYVNLSILLGNIMLLHMWRRSALPYNRQAAAMFLGSLFPWVGLVIYLAGYSPLKLDTSPFGLTIAGLIYAWGLIRYRMFDVVPVARGIIFEKMLDGVLVVDAQGRVVDMNATAQSLFGTKRQVIGRQLVDFLPSIAETSADVMSAESGHLELQENVPDGTRWMDVVFSPLTDYRGELQGRALIVRDITGRKEDEARMESINAELTGRIRELNQHNSEVRLINEMTADLQSCHGLQEACVIIPPYLRSLFPGVGGGLYAYSPEHERMELVSHWNESSPTKPYLLPGECWGMQQGFSHLVRAGQTKMVCEYCRPETDNMDYICTPLIIEGKNYALLHYSYPVGELDENCLQLNRTVSDAIILALCNLKMKETLLQQLTRDPLSQLFNRRYMEETLQIALAQAKRSDRSLSIIKLDIDYFRKLNDTHGHFLGDQILRQVSQLLRQNIRSGDIPCRYGGDEFVLILPECSLELAHERAELIRGITNVIQIRAGEDQAEMVSISVGVASYPDHAQTPETLLQAADIALQKAKQSGRNVVVEAG